VRPCASASTITRPGAVPPWEVVQAGPCYSDVHIRVNECARSRRFARIIYTPPRTPCFFLVIVDFWDHFLMIFWCLGIGIWDRFSRDFFSFGTTFWWYFGVSGSLFCDIFVSGDLLGHIWFLGGSRGVKPRSRRHAHSRPVAPFGITLDHFFDQKVVYFCVVFLYAFLDCFFIDFSWFWDAFWELF